MRARDYGFEPLVLQEMGGQFVGLTVSFLNPRNRQIEATVGHSGYLRV